MSCRLGISSSDLSSAEIEAEIWSVFDISTQTVEFMTIQVDHNSYKRIPKPTLLRKIKGQAIGYHLVFHWSVLPKAKFLDVA